MTDRSVEAGPFLRKFLNFLLIFPRLRERKFPIYFLKSFAFAIDVKESPLTVQNETQTTLVARATR